MAKSNQNNTERPIHNDYVFDEEEYYGFEPVYDEDRRAYNEYDDYNKTGSGRTYDDAYDDTYDGFVAGDTLRRSRAESAGRMESTNMRPETEDDKKKKKRSIGKIIGVSFACILLVVVNVVSVVAFGMLNNMNTITNQQIEENRVQGEQLAELDKEFAESETDIDTDAVQLPTDYIMSTDDVSLFLLVGSDSRFGVSSTARGDTMMIIAIDRVHKKIKMVSVMRDLYAIIPGYKNNKLNTSFYYDSRYGNLDLKITFKTIERNLGMKIEDYVVVDFTGFQTIVDIIGGIEIEVNDPESRYMCYNKKYGLFPRYQAGPGVYNMNGAEALNYARMRKVGNGDYERTARQRKVISKIIEKMKGSDVGTLYNVAMACMDSVVTNLSSQEITGYAMEAVDILGYEIVQMRIPIDGSFKETTVYNGKTPMSVLWPNYSWNAKQLQKFIFEDDMTYVSGGKTASVKVPEMPAGTVTSLDEKPVESTTAETETTTSATESTAAPTTTTTAAPTTTTTTTTTAAPTTTTAAPTEAAQPSAEGTE